MEWIKQILANNKKRVSIIHFVRTTEYSRSTHLFTGLRKKFKTFLTYDPWNGLREVKHVKLSNDIEVKEQPFDIGDIGNAYSDPNDPITAMHAIINELRKKNCLAVIEHFDTICERCNGLPDMNDALRFLIKEYDYRSEDMENSALVIFTKNTNEIAKDVLDHTLLYDVSGSTEKERRMLLENGLAERKKDPDLWVPEDVDIDGVVAAGAGLTMIQFNNAIVMGFSVKQVTPRYISSAKRLILEVSEIGKIITPEDAISPDKIGGYENVKNIITLTAEKAVNRKKAENLGCGRVRGIMLFGAPGTGKSLLAKALAKLMNRPVIDFSASDIFTKWFGESTQKLRKITELAEETGAILYIDEVDGIVGGRDTSGQTTQNEETGRVLSEFLRYLGDIDRKAIVVGTTNLPNAIDFAMLRAGRFDKIIYVPLPDLAARKAIFDVHINNPIDHPKVKLAKDVDIDKLAENTEYFSGAEIAQVVKDACDYAFEDNAKSVKMAYFLEAIEGNRPNSKKRQQLIKVYEAYAKLYCRGLRQEQRDEMIPDDATDLDDIDPSELINLKRLQ